MYHREMPLSTRFIKAIKWLVAWIMLIIYYLKTGNFAEYDIWNAVGISLPFYIAMYRIFFNNIDELMVVISALVAGGVFYLVPEIFDLLVNKKTSELLKFKIQFLGAFLLCVIELFFLNGLLLKILPIIG